MAFMAMPSLAGNLFVRGGIRRLGIGAHRQLGWQDQQTRQRTVFAPIAFEICQRVHSGFFPQHFARGDIFHIEKVSGPEGLLRSNQQIALTAQIVVQGRIEGNTPENIPFTNFFVGERVDDQVVIVFRIDG